jgi:hypothetical protein
LAYQLVVLGARPEQESPIPLWWHDGTVECGDVWRPTDPSNEYLIGNRGLEADLKLLLALRLVRWSSDRLVPTFVGLEALELPSVMFVSRLPAPTRMELALAELRFHDGSYGSCAQICGRALEWFTKEAIRYLHPDESGRRSIIARALEGNRPRGEVDAKKPAPSVTSPGQPLEKLELGKLCTVLSFYIGEKEKERNEFLQRTLPQQQVERLFRHAKAGEHMCNVLRVCRDLRNRWAHDDSTGIAGLPSASDVESASHLLHLTRVFVCMFCDEFKMDPAGFGDPEAIDEESPASGHARPDEPGCRLSRGSAGSK